MTSPVADQQAASAKADGLTFLGALAFAFRLWQFWVTLGVGIVAVELTASLTPPSWRLLWHSGSIGIMGGTLGGVVRARYFHERQSAQPASNPAGPVRTEDGGQCRG